MENLTLDSHNKCSDAVNGYKNSITSLNDNLAQQYMLQGLIGKEVPATKEDFDAYRQSVIDAAVSSGQFIGTNEEITASVDGVLKSQSRFSSFYADELKDAGGAAAQVEKAVTNLTERVKEMQAAYKALETAQQEMTSGAGLSAETIQALAEANENYLDFLYEENGVIKLNIDAWRENANSKMESEMLDIEREIRGLQEQNSELEKQNQTLSDSMEIIHTILHPVFAAAVRDGYIRTDPTDGVMSEIKRSHDWEKPKRHALTEDQQTAFVDLVSKSATYNHWLPLFTLMLGTGCRIGEVVGLRWEDCDFEENLISVNHNLIYRQQSNGKCEFHITTPKTKAGIRIVPMLTKVREALLSELERQKMVGFCQAEVDGYSGFVFGSGIRGCLSPHCVNRAIERICREYNAQETQKAKKEKREPVILPHFSAHNLRHTFCTRFCENETNIKVIQEIMGHADIETTMNIYAEATKEKKMASFAQLDGKIKIG